MLLKKHNNLYACLTLACERKDPRIRFETKEQSNARREAEFLALSPHDRFMVFLKGFSRSGSEAPATKEKNDNFIIRRKKPA